ncbi:hypothetical protein BDV93DRAFT_555976 [Ceratobasidium sp. AG-I]|nr:hypothetical protein BDV93DRAFT_555976 [Ceratobasidium sp. AG-I]
MEYESPLNNELPNNPPPVHRLPSELLSRIFILGADTYRTSRKVSLRDFRLQDIATQVCRYWREVGLQTPMLWRYIFISQPSSHLRAQLYLARAGPLCPLDIELDVPDTDPSEVSTQVLQTLRLIVSRGGDIARWRSLTVLANVPLAILAALGSICSSSLPGLRFLSLNRRSNGWADVLHDTEAMIVARMVLGNSHWASLGPQAPQLHSVELIGLPSNLVFDRSSPMLSNLRYLKLGCGATRYPINGIGKLLSASPKLEHLGLDMGAVPDSDLESDDAAPSKVLLPLLRSLSLQTNMSNEWGASLLKMIDAPSVDSFRLHCRSRYYFEEMLQFICTGRLKGVLQSHFSTSEPQYEPIFPSLRSLKIADPVIDSIFLENLLATYPTITEITVDIMALQTMSKVPELLPNLSLIRYSGSLVHRCAAFIQAINEGRAQIRLSPIRVVALRRKIIQENGDTEYQEIRSILGGLVDKIELYDEEEDFTADNDY